MHKTKPLWTPSQPQMKATYAFHLMEKMNVASWQELYQLSLQDQNLFWTTLWDFFDILGHKQGAGFVEAPDKAILGAQFFPKSTLNFAENCLRWQNDTPAIHFKRETKPLVTLSWRELYESVEKCVSFFRDNGLKKGDRLAAMLPNCPETVIIFLACSALGIIFSSCSPDFGEDGVIDRFSQITPHVFVACDGYIYHGKKISLTEKIEHIVPALASLEHLIVVPVLEKEQKALNTPIPTHFWEELMSKTDQNVTPLSFEAVAFSHPAAILYSSGTTGKPKCIVHSTGGMLLQLMKEHKIHCDIKPKDKVFYFTTCSWMMWNWLIAALASQATLCLYDGSPKFPDDFFLFSYAEEVGFTHFGISAKLISIWEKDGIIPKKHFSLKSLRMILSTGSPLLEKEFHYVYESIKKDIMLASISGGTDIASCFLLGCPLLPVYAGQLQTPGLGLAVDVFTDEGKPAPIGEKGELVCTKPFIAMPVGFYNDPENKKYKSTYFERFPNVWYHGDFAEKTDQNGFIIHGRSDATLKPGGIRIGTAEIYAQVEKNPAIQEALVVGQNWEGDVRIILFIILRASYKLEEQLIQTIKKSIRAHVSPHHVPHKVIAVADFPRTRSGKLSEILVHDLINHIEPKNVQAIANPESLAYFKDLSDLKF